MHLTCLMSEQKSEHIYWGSQTVYWINTGIEITTTFKLTWKLCFIIIQYKVMKKGVMLCIDGNHRYVQTNY